MLEHLWFPAGVSKELFVYTCPRPAGLDLLRTSQGGSQNVTSTSEAPERTGGEQANGPQPAEVQPAEVQPTERGGHRGRLRRF